MKISGRRADGAMYLSMGAGVAVIVRGNRVSPPLDEASMDKFGPWKWSPDDSSFEARQIAGRLLDRALTDANVVQMGLIAMKEAVKKDEPVSDVAESAQKAPEEGVEVINLQPDAVAAAAATNEPPNPHFPADERKKKRAALKDKINGTLKSQKKVSEMLGDEDVSDDDLYAMAKSLGIPVDERPAAVSLMDNAAKFRSLLSTTTLAQHLADKQEHPFTYCKEHIIPKMEAEGKAPDDVDAFCAWWKQENG